MATSMFVQRKIPKDLTQGLVSGAGLSIVAAVFMVFLFGMELSDFLSVKTTTTVPVDNSEDAYFLRIDFNLGNIMACETCNNFTKTHCPICHKDFDTYQMLLNHQEKDHRAQLQNKCRKCHIRFETQDDCNKHVREQHHRGTA